MSFFQRIWEGEDLDVWYCPRGHNLMFEETEVERLRKELTDAQGKANQLEALLQAEHTKAKQVGP